MLPRKMVYANSTKKHWAAIVDKLYNTVQAALALCVGAALEREDLLPGKDAGELRFIGKALRK